MKKFYKSKTVIFNVVTLIVGICSQIEQLNFSPEITKVVLLISLIGNIILRFKTTEPITLL